MSTATCALLPVEAHQPLPIGSFKDIPFHVVSILDSAIAKASSETGSTLHHLRVFEQGRNRMTIEDLRGRNISLEEFQKFLISDEVQAAVMLKYGEPLWGKSYGWSVSFNLRLAPGCIHADIVLGDLDLMKRLKHITISLT